MDRVVLWDFDGTLAYRPGKWVGAIVEALDEFTPCHGIDEEDVRPLIRDGFPWHQPQMPHPHLSTPNAWWAYVVGLLTKCMRRLGFDDESSVKLAQATRRRFLDPSSFHAFEDTRETLEVVAASGWRNVVLSNHVPELESIVTGVGLGGLIEQVFTSALIGYEKPHPEAFAIAKEQTGYPKNIWMVGDNPDADVLGAEAVGIPAVLVRREDDRVNRQAPDLISVIKMIVEPANAQ